MPIFLYKAMLCTPLGDAPLIGQHTPEMVSYVERILFLQCVDDTSARPLVRYLRTFAYQNVPEPVLDESDEIQPTFRQRENLIVSFQSETFVMEQVTYMLYARMQLLFVRAQYHYVVHVPTVVLQMENFLAIMVDV